MKLTLTKREKILLFSVGLIVLIYLAVQFGFAPLISRYTVAQGEILALSAEAAAIEAEIAAMPSIIDENKTANERFDEIISIYPLLVAYEDIDTTMTNLCLYNSLPPTTWRIRPIEPQGGEQENPLFADYNVSMNVSGSYYSLLDLLDEVNDMQYMRISNLSFALDRTGEDGAGATVYSSSDNNISLSFVLTYVNPT